VRAPPRAARPCAKGARRRQGARSRRARSCRARRSGGAGGRGPRAQPRPASRAPPAPPRRRPQSPTAGRRGGRTRRTDWSRARPRCSGLRRAGRAARPAGLSGRAGNRRPVQARPAAEPPRTRRAVAPRSEPRPTRGASRVRRAAAASRVASRAPEGRKAPAAWRTSRSARRATVSSGGMKLGTTSGWPRVSGEKLRLAAAQRAPARMNDAPSCALSKHGRRHRTVEPGDGGLRFSAGTESKRARLLCRAGAHAPREVGTAQCHASSARTLAPCRANPPHAPPTARTARTTPATAAARGCSACSYWPRSAR
jgi:hypothetical protein